MCGIAAIVSTDGRPVPDPEPAIRRAAAALRHRGPDGQTTWISPSRRAALGHALLAVTHPDGRQPIASEDRRLHIAASGQFYGHAPVRKSLEARGHRFRTRSDTENALHLYEELGAGCLPQLRGQFAFVIWDEERGALFAARDRFGLKPLFYAESKGRLIVASEAKALWAAGVAPSWDLRGVFHALHACPDERRSLFAGISQLPPGHLLRADRHGVRLERWWDLPAAPRGHGADPDFAQEAERVRELLEESVALRMEASVPVGCLLSGGLDSSAALGVAASLRDRPVAAFTVGFERRDVDETAGAREAASACGADHHVATLSDQDLADNFADAVWHAETLQYNTHGAARYLLSRAVSAAGYRAVLAGEGADEAFFGYEFLRAAAAAAAGRGGGLAPRRLLRLAAAFLRSPRRAHPGLAAVSPWLARVALVLPSNPSLFTRLARGLGHVRSVCEAGFLERFAGFDLYRDYHRRCRRAAGPARREPARQLLYMWLHSLFVNYHLAADRLDMAHGVEVRLPYLDHVLFEHVNALPVSLLAGRAREKELLREAARPYVSEAVLGRVKRPFWGPSVRPGGGPLHDFVQDALRGDSMREVPFVSHAAVLRLLDRLPALPAADRPSLDSLLLMLASAAALQERCRL